MSEIDVSKCEFYNNNYCSCYRDNYGDCYHKCTDEELKDCYYKQLQQLKAKLKEINEIAHWRMGEVDIHLHNRLSKIQELSK